MVTNSIHTNSGAIIALQSLNKTNRELDVVQKRVSTGFKIADSRDDSAGFTIAQGIRADQAARGAVIEQLRKGRGLLTVASEAAKLTSDTLIKTREVLTRLADESVTGTQRAQYTADYNSLKDEILNFIENAIFNDINLLDGGDGLNIIDNIDGDTLSLTGQDLITNVHSFLIDVPTDATGASIAQSMISTAGAGGSFVTAQTNLGFAMGDLGAELRRLDNQILYLGVIEDANTEGLGAIVDADLAKESARLQALQVRQQLGTQTLAIANANPQILLNFFG